MPGPPLPGAVVFDFDGTIFDSETPIYRASAAAVASLGHELTIQGWATVVGHGEEDSWRALVAAVGAELDRDAYEAAYGSQDRSWRDTLPALPGILELVDELHGAGVPLGIASSSPAEWLETHLTRLGLRDRFTSVASRDRVGGRSKPAPDTYQLACRELGVDPARAVAIEDSSPGVAAALGAGLNVVVVPTEITRHTDTSAAHLTVGSVADLTLADLAELVATRTGTG